MDDLNLFEKLKDTCTLIHKDADGIPIIDKLNGFIHGDKHTQRFALCVLNLVLKNCDYELLEENATLWMRFLLQLINTIPSDDLLKLCFVTLSQLLEFAKKIDKVSRDIATRGIDPLLTLLIGSPLPISSEKLNLIKCCIKNFPGASGQHRSAINKLLISIIESDDHPIAAYKVYALLPTCGSAGDGKNKYVDSWISQFHLVVNTTNFYMTKLNYKAAGIAVDTCVEEDTSKLVLFSEISERLELNMSKAPAKIEKLILMLKHLIGTPQSFEIPFPLLRLIHLFCDLSNMIHLELRDSCSNLEKVKIINGLLQCISLTVNQFKSLLIPYQQQIMNILISVISSSCITNRTHLYQCLFNVCVHWKVLPITSNIIDSIFDCIVRDIKINDWLPSGGVSNTQNKNDNVHSLIQDINEQSKKEINHFNYVLHENAYAAMTLLERILIFNGAVLSADNLMLIISNILRILVRLYANKRSFLPPYSCDDNRLVLFKVVKCLLTLHHGSTQIPISSLLYFIKVGTTEKHDGIKSFCYDVILQYDSVIHNLSHSFYDNWCIPNDEKSSYDKSSFKFEDIKEDIKTKEESSSPPTLSESEVPLTDENPSSFLGTQQCDSTSYELMNVTKSSELPLRKDSSLYQSMRLCKSVDQVLLMEAVKTVVPTRSSSEPIPENTAGANYNTSVPNGMCKENNIEMHQDFDDGPVVISDSSEEGDASFSLQDDLTAPNSPQSSQNGCGDELQEDNSEPSIKKQKLNDDGKSSFDDEGYDAYEDQEFIKILDSFCEIDADH